MVFVWERVNMTVAVLVQRRVKESAEHWEPQLVLEREFDCDINNQDKENHY